MPRAIKFAAAFYSIGLPPELLGLSALNEKEFDELHELYQSIDADLSDSAKYLNKKVLQKLPTQIRDSVNKVLSWIDYEIDEEYADITSRIYDKYISLNHSHLSEDVKAAAWKRKFLG
jgi:phosphoenolpyruvate carboxylase